MKTTIPYANKEPERRMVKAVTEGVTLTLEKLAEIYDRSSDKASVKAKYLELELYRMRRPSQQEGIDVLAKIAVNNGVSAGYRQAAVICRQVIEDLEKNV